MVSPSSARSRRTSRRKTRPGMTVLRGARDLPRRAPRVAPALAVTVALLLPAFPARAQIFRLEAGSSSLDRASGGSVFVKGDPFEAWFGLGALDPVLVGGAFRTRLRGADLTLGDDVVPLRLPTDVFDPGHAFFTRGFGLGLTRGETKALLAGGRTSTIYSAPYFTAARSDDAIGIFQFE